MTGFAFGQGYPPRRDELTSAGMRSPPGGTTVSSEEPRGARAAIRNSQRRPTVLDDVFSDLACRLDELVVVATRRREPRPDDAVADGIEWVVSQLRVALAEIDANHEYLSPEQYGNLHGVTPQSVGNWIRKGELEAVTTPNGWRIKRGALRQQKRRRL